MEMQKTRFNFDFMSKRKVGLVVSSLLIIMSIISMSMEGLTFGVDFTGGTLIEVGYSESVDLESYSNIVK